MILYTRFTQAYSVATSLEAHMEGVSTYSLQQHTGDGLILALVRLQDHQPEACVSTATCI